jgi:hypothetical protein
MVDRKQTSHIKEKVTAETYDTPEKYNALEKNPTVEKEKINCSS